MVPDSRRVNVARKAEGTGGTQFNVAPLVRPVVTCPPLLFNRYLMCLVVLLLKHTLTTNSAGGRTRDPKIFHLTSSSSACCQQHLEHKVNHPAPSSARKDLNGASPWRDTRRMFYSGRVPPRRPPERPLKSGVTNETREIMVVQRWSTVKRISDHQTIKMIRCRGDNHFTLGCVARVKVGLGKYHLPLIWICECPSIKTCACAVHC